MTVSYPLPEYVWLPLNKHVCIARQVQMNGKKVFEPDPSKCIGVAENEKEAHHLCIMHNRALEITMPQPPKTPNGP